MKSLLGKEIAIVGAGFTGLTAAYKLSELGAKVTIFEAGENAGGLAAGCTLLNEPIEKAYHFIYKTDKYMLKLLKELNLDESLTFHRSSVSTFIEGELYPMTNPFDLIRFSPLKLHNRIRLGLCVLYLQRIKKWQKLTKITALEWLNRFCGKEVTKVIWQPLLKGKFDHYFDKVTMAWLWGRIKQRADSQDRDLNGEALGYINGGFEKIVNELIKRITDNKNCKILFNTTIESINYDSNFDKNIIKYKNKSKEFNKVLLTVPCKVASKLLNDYRQVDPIYFEKLESINYLDAAILLFATDKPISDYYWHNINSPDAPFVVFIGLTELIGNKRFKGKHVYYIGDYIPNDHLYMRCTEKELEKIWFDALEKMFPSFKRESVIERKLFRFANAQHIVDIDFEKKIVPFETPCKGVFLSNFSQIFPMDRGTNYAVRDGYRMAELFAKKG